MSSTSISSPNAEHCGQWYQVAGRLYPLVAANAVMLLLAALVGGLLLLVASRSWPAALLCVWAIGTNATLITYCNGLWPEVQVTLLLLLLGAIGWWAFQRRRLWHFALWGRTRAAVRGAARDPFGAELWLRRPQGRDPTRPG